jgi:hypothetical protein
MYPANLLILHNNEIGTFCIDCTHTPKRTETDAKSQGFQHVWRRCRTQSLCARTTTLPQSTGYENDGHGSTFWQLVQQ